MATKAAKESEIEQSNWHWRNTMRPVRFFNLDARAGLPFFILLVYARPVTLALTLLMTAMFWFLDRRGLTFPCALRALRVWLIGNGRPAWVIYRRRHMRDYG